MILNSVYDDNTTIHYTLNHYIDLINEIKKVENNTEDNPIIDKLKDIWTDEEIIAIKDLINLVLQNKDKDIYINSLNDIVTAKEKIVYEYINKISTTY